MPLQQSDFTAAIRALGIQNKCIEVHASFKSFGTHVEGGAPTVINAFLQEGCTYLAFAYTTAHYAVYPPIHLRPRQNAVGDYSQFNEADFPPPRIYTVASTEITLDELGLLPHTVVHMPERKRSASPLNSFAAVGPLADELVRTQTAADVFAPLRRLCELDGVVVLMGVTLTRATIIHFAEQVAGRAPFVRWAKNAQGETEICHIGSCSSGFDRLQKALAGIETRVTVGDSIWRCYPARRMVDICAAAIAADPEITRCDTPNCARCEDAIAGGPVWA